jgi:hypothetical protein
MRVVPRALKIKTVVMIYQAKNRELKSRLRRQRRALIITGFWQKERKTAGKTKIEQWLNNEKNLKNGSASYEIYYRISRL